MWEILRILQAGTTSVETIEKESYMMEYNTLEQIASLPSPRVLNNHMPWDSQPRDLVDGKVKVVFFYRNPKDVAVSFFHHHRRFKDYAYSGSFDNYLKRLVQGKGKLHVLHKFHSINVKKMAFKTKIKRAIKGFEFSISQFL